MRGKKISAAEVESIFWQMVEKYNIADAEEACYDDFTEVAQEINSKSKKHSITDVYIEQIITDYFNLQF